jgi:hypothetical protein
LHGAWSCWGYILEASTNWALVGYRRINNRLWGTCLFENPGKDTWGRVAKVAMDSRDVILDPSKLRVARVVFWLCARRVSNEIL